MKPQEAWEQHRELSEIFNVPISKDEEDLAYKHFMAGFLRGEEHGTELAAKRIADVARGKR